MLVKIIRFFFAYGEIALLSLMQKIALVKKFKITLLSKMLINSNFFEMYAWFSNKLLTSVTIIPLEV